ncbi:MAG: hypothetical protein CMB52_05580 [Euryarchaeota archaeon]|nr:hypothetical protein [Euryarchaeota archaeon]|tara:strand:- start:10970 stop:11161 length:192 start_codon:yes stop_codon:yes gene_type:complete
MKKGDLVKVKFVTGASRRRAMAREFPVDEPGLVIEEAENAVKVLFPSLGKIRSFLKSSLKELK